MTRVAFSSPATATASHICIQYKETTKFLLGFKIGNPFHHTIMAQSLIVKFHHSYYGSNDYYDKDLSQRTLISCATEVS